MMDFSFEDLGIEGLDFESETAERPNWYEHVGCSQQVKSIVDEARSQFKAKLKSVREIEDKTNVKKKDYQLVVGNITEAVGLNRTYLKNRHQNEYQQLVFEFINQLNERLRVVFETKDLKTKVQSQKDKAMGYERLAKAFSDLSQFKAAEFATACFDQHINERLTGEESKYKALVEQNEELQLDNARLQMQIAELARSLRIAEEKVAQLPNSNVVELGKKK